MKGLSPPAEVVCFSVGTAQQEADGMVSVDEQTLLMFTCSDKMEPSDKTLTV